MNELFDKVRIQEEAALLEYFDNVFNIKAINSLLTFKEEEAADHSLPFYMRGYYLPIYEEFGGAIHENCRKTLERIGLKKNNIEFYVSNDANFNSSSIASTNKETPDIIIFNRGLIERVTPEEFSFVIGHEIGHLVFRHSEVKKVFQFVYPDFNDLPPILQKLYEFWSQLGEISADRIGFLACRDLEASTRALFKLSSGIDEKNFNLSHENIMNIAEKTFSEMKSHPAHVSATHPANPIRIKALASLSKSALMKSITDGGKLAEDEDLTKEINDIVDVLRKKPFNSRECAEMDFLAAAGTKIIIADENVSRTEYNYLNNILSRYLHWPPAYLDQFIEDKNPDERLQAAAKWIIENCPWRTRDLLQKLFPIVIRDHSIHDKELKAFLDIGTEIFKIPFSEIVDIILEGIRKRYAPLN